MFWRFTTLFSLFAVATARPTRGLRKRAADPVLNETQILNFALTLEHLENAFYTLGLSEFDQDAFVKAGLPAFTRGRFEQIAEHEATHVQFLTEALGPDATAACNYSFPFTDPNSFVALASILENGGVSAYLGAAQFLSDKAHLTAAGSILTTEARQNAWIHSAVLKLEPWSRAFDTPLTFDQVFTLASGFIVSCPATNPVLPVKAFPSLAVVEAAPAPGSTIHLTFNSTTTAPTFLALFAGLNTTFVPITNATALLPTGLQGTVYGVVTTNGTAVSDDTTIAGVAVFDFAFPSQADN
ncbi:hypothetical protein SISNIDRAFT_507377 [Sistotremastrum niveocremeum HHB9708]|uniref:Uncharacterized protein n=1 Tax=Sistotremastrum niveocremeum HHB9708 TaxID=1314777 RepID=A0A164UNL8_9AGAM|nr:hypothetical protein SISNIDRAFT_507377 [Sistotremastrum niveocremeum HHB9708]